MPFPNSQYSNSLGLSFFINHNIWWLRIIGFLLVISPFLYYLRKGRWWQKVIMMITLLLYAYVLYYYDYKVSATEVFGEMKEKTFLNSTSDASDKLAQVIGVEINGEAKAYPLLIIGYHHELEDTVGNVPVLVTYCTLCHTSRVFGLVVNGKRQQFRLVGIVHLNATLEDNDTKSWWQQASGVAIAGKLKGMHLPEIKSSQTSLRNWLTLHPNSVVLQPDNNYKQQYKDFDDGSLKIF